jgi:hypothetical protein
LSDLPVQEAVILRGCPFCGKTISDSARECPFCHENIPQVRLSAVSNEARGNAAMHRGLWYMLILAVVYFFFTQKTPLKIPLPFAPTLTHYLLPGFFFVALIFVLYGIYMRVK